MSSEVITEVRVKYLVGGPIKADNIPKDVITWQGKPLTVAVARRMVKLLTTSGYRTEILIRTVTLWEKISNV